MIPPARGGNVVPRWKSDTRCSQRSHVIPANTTKLSCTRFTQATRHHHPRTLGRSVAGQMRSMTIRPTAIAIIRGTIVAKFQPHGNARQA